MEVEMNEVLAKIKSLVPKSIDVVSGLVDGLRAQVATTKGAILLLIAVVVVLDVFMKGQIGVVGYSIAQAKDILTACSAVLKEGGWQLIAFVLLLIVLKDRKVA
jgi:hypothetical protein